MRSKNYAVRSVQYAIVIIFAVLCIYPILWLLVNSFKDNAALYADPWGIPAVLELENYVRAFVVGNIGKYFWNSVLIAVPAVGATVLLSGMAAYGIVRLKWKLSAPVMSLFLLGMMIPTHAVVIPLLSIFNKMGLINFYFLVIIPNVAFGLPIGILIISGFFQTIPKEIEEAAIIDGASIIGTFFKIICPVSVSSMITVSVISFITVWNDLLFPQIFLSNPDKMTLPVGLSAFKGRYSTDYVGMIAAVVITIIPTIIIYSTLHDKIIDGMTAGAVKG